MYWKYLAIILLLFYIPRNSYGQKEDYMWLSGYDSRVGYDSSQNALYGISVLNFNHTPRQVSYDSLGMNFDETNISYCDSNGNLLFYSNGIYIANALDQKIENGDSLNAGYFQYVWDPVIQEYGYRVPQGMIAIKNPANLSQYYLLHTFVDSIPGSGGEDLYNKSILCTLLDMSENSGLGKVLYKNREVLSNNISVGVTATRHGNGRDWWAIVQKRNTNCYYKILVNESGVDLIDSACENVPITYNNINSSNFSPDGSKYANLTYREGLVLFDFDRCNGVMSNSKFIPMPFLQDSGWIGLGVAFSPNNRFVYAFTTMLALQYDLWATDIVASVDTVGVYDGYQAPFGSYFNTAQNGPDGKIYISCGNGEKDYHVVEYPDRKGDSCMFMQHSIQLPTFSGGVPNFPNYRLGALAGSACDTITGLNEAARAEKEKILKVFPNPASDVVTVDYGFTDWNKGDVELEIVNELGQVVYQQQLPRYSGFQKVDVNLFASGVYNIFIKRNNQIVANAKFAKQ